MFQKVSKLSFPKIFRSLTESTLIDLCFAFPNLRSLNLSKCVQLNNFSAIVSSLPNLEAINLSYCNVFTSSVAQVCKLAFLKELNLDYTEISDDCFFIFLGSKLEVLTLSGCTLLTMVGLTSFLGKTSIKDLILSKTKLGDSLGKVKNNCIKLLDLQSCQKLSFLALNQFSALVELSVTCCKNLRQLTLNLPQLGVLNVSSTYVTELHLNVPNLEYVNAASCPKLGINHISVCVGI